MGWVGPRRRLWWHDIVIGWQGQRSRLGLSCKHLSPDGNFASTELWQISRACYVHGTERRHTAGNTSRTSPNPVRVKTQGGRRVTKEPNILWLTGQRDRAQGGVSVLVRIGHRILRRPPVDLQVPWPPRFCRATRAPVQAWATPFVYIAYYEGL